MVQIFSLPSLLCLGIHCESSNVWKIILLNATLAHAWSRPYPLCSVHWLNTSLHDVYIHTSYLCYLQKRRLRRVDRWFQCWQQFAEWSHSPSYRTTSCRLLAALHPHKWGRATSSVLTVRLRLRIISGGVSCQYRDQWYIILATVLHVVT